MKQYLKHKHLPWLAGFAGIAGLLLRFWHLSTETDRGFIVRGHFAGVALVILTLAFLALMIFAVRPLVQASKYGFNFPASLPGAVGTAAAALTFALTGVLDLAGGNIPVGLLGLMAAGALVFLGKCRWEGQHPSPIFHILLCVYLLVRLLTLYRQWSGTPQLQEYVYPMLAMVFLMVSTYHRANFSANMGNRRLYTFFSLSAAYFCLLSLAGPMDIWFYLGAACWLITDQCNLTPMPHRFQERTE